MIDLSNLSTPPVPPPRCPRCRHPASEMIGWKTFGHWFCPHCNFEWPDKMTADTEQRLPWPIQATDDPQVGAISGLLEQVYELERQHDAAFAWLALVGAVSAAAYGLQIDPADLRRSLKDAIANLPPVPDQAPPNYVRLWDERT